MTWTVEQDQYGLLYHVIDESGFVIVTNVSKRRAELIASAPQLAEENKTLRRLIDHARAALEGRK